MKSQAQFLDLPDRSMTDPSVIQLCRAALHCAISEPSTNWASAFPFRLNSMPCDAVQQPGMDHLQGAQGGDEVRPGEPAVELAADLQALGDAPEVEHAAAKDAEDLWS